MPAFEFQEPAILGEDLLMIRAQVRRFVETEVVPKADQWEIDGTVPREIFRKLGALGFLGMRYPVEYGGGGLGPLASVVLGEELARSGYGGFATSITVHSDMSIGHIAHRGTDAQKRKYLPPACAGEKVGAI